MEKTADTELLREVTTEIADPESFKQLENCVDIFL
jgi:hypothetical protein